MKIDFEKLKLKMFIRKITQRKIAECLGQTEGTVSRKFKGDVSFSLADVQVIVLLLDLTPDEIAEIFFAQKTA